MATRASGTPSKAAVYARISKDTEGVGAGVQRQVADCQNLAESLGWTVADTYIDNDLSAYTGKPRPEYARMLADLADGLVDGVLCYHMDRLTRRPKELEEFVEALDAAAVKHVRFVAGHTDIGTGDGLMMARVMGAFASHESASKTRRMERKWEQDALEGKPRRSGTRPFGYAADAVTLVPEEAAIIRQLVDRFLAGESTRSLCVWLKEEGVATTSGGNWQTSTLKQILTSGRIAGYREHRGVKVAKAVWEPIITEEQHRQVLAHVEARKRSGRRAPQRYLLSGMLRCGRCGNRLYSSARRDTRRYVCQAGPDHFGCGRLTVVADPVERLIADAVLHRLDSPQMADALAGKVSSDERTAVLSQALEEDEAQMQELAQAYAAKQIRMSDWLTAKKPIEERIENTRRQMDRMNGHTALARVAGQGQELRQQWAGLNLERQHAIVKTVLDHAVIRPMTPGVRKFDPNRVAPVWLV
ncbi:recombinase family protein [Ornithinimicrobium pekingense]|uniref:Serine recombinase n=1 Tax=Ornithinimicrobium pekingense TaxID=384677 RepID=A0ABQ2F4H6_9MICO|nr:recombinase family protein [Ornithinimicrobium pekingense]GGK60186.1 serine recombinase [Ornithinimicrobium pekingense]